jgi:membrane protease YdiL (CAAX protease family)
MTRRNQALLALVLIAPIQLVGTTAAMVWFPDSTVAKVGFGVAKVLLMLAPIAWLIWIEKTRPRIPRWDNFPWGRGMAAAHATGLLIFVVIAAAYYTVGRRWIHVEPMLDKVGQMGLDRRWLYLLGALYWCTINSLLEEYFWRWFIFERLREVLPKQAMGVALAVVLGGLLFTAHHVVALRVYFDWPTTLLASLGVFVGGVTWSGLYLKYRNVYACYVSHVWADVIIFWIGWQLIFGAG